jgi:twitching motility protein PilT
MATLSVRGLLEEMIERQASDLHLTAGDRPKLRVDGDLVNANVDHVLMPKDTLQLTYSILTESQKKRFEQEDELDFSFGIQNLARFRGNAYRQRGCVAMAIRLIPFNIMTFEELGLPPILRKLSERPRGLVLVTGPTGSGKSTTLAAMVDHINKTRKGHIITIEEPIEFIHRHQNCMINQREVGSDTQSFSNALKYALRQDPDVLLVGEMRDLETIAMTLTAAETGHLALATLHTNSAAESINRIIDVFPSHQQSQVRVAACEVLVATPAIRSVIREAKIQQIYGLMQAGKKHGMQTLNDALYQLYLANEVKLEEALKRTSDPNELLRMAGEPVPA